MTSPALLPEFKTCPAVFAVKNDYQIMVPVKSDLLFWVTVDGKNYYDHSNGIIRSSTRMHRVNVPMCALDKTGEYTVTYRKIIDRKPYFAETEEPVSEPIRSVRFRLRAISTFIIFPIRMGNSIFQAKRRLILAMTSICSS